MAKEQNIEKGKWNVGDILTNKKGTFRCTGISQTTGRPTWSRIKDGESKAQQAPTQKQAKTDDSGTKQQQAPTQKPAAPKKQAPYDAPTPKIEYKTKRPADGVVFEVPEIFQVKKSSTGKVEDASRKEYRTTYSKVDDDKIIKMLNNEHNSKYVRQLLYEEAMARGIDEDKIDVSGTLQEEWDRIAGKNSIMNASKKTEDEDESFEDYDMSLLQGMDPDKFVEENFIEGDYGWRDRQNPAIKKEFNDLKTLADRKRYDSFLDYMNRKDPDYRDPQGQMNDLKILFLEFLESSSKDNPLMVSAGGAGAGKSTGFEDVANLMEMVEFDPDKHKPGDGDYHYVRVAKDVDNDKDFFKLLHEHNGKVIVFDDKDRLLVTNANKLVSTMKGIADGNPKLRLFDNPETGQPERFTGKLLFITNKNMDTLNKDDDHVAIMSRAMKHDIRMTINENLELLKSRYKTMGGQFFKDPQEDAYYREELWKFINKNKDKLDPDKFTVRKFTEAMKTIRSRVRANKMIAQNEDAESVFGSANDWQAPVRQVLNKAVVYTDFEDTIKKREYKGDKSKVLLMYKKNPEKFVEVFGKDFLDILMDDDKRGDNNRDEDIEESFMNDIGDMSIEDAESLLFQ